MVEFQGLPLEYECVLQIRTWHVAILCRHAFYPNYRYLLHLWSPDWSKENAMFRLDPFEDVVYFDGEAKVYNGILARFEGDEILQRSFSLLGQGGYHLFQNNCQHAVSWILNGEAKSPDVETAKGIAVTFGSVALVVGGLALVAKLTEGTGARA